MNALQELKVFADKHGIIVQEEGECGFGRPCVGLIQKGSGNYVDYNPLDSINYEPIYDEDDRFYAPDGVNSYHKHNCFAVLVDDDNYGEGLTQLNKWIQHLESQGELEFVTFPTGATGLQALISGMTGSALIFKS